MEQFVSDKRYQQDPRFVRYCIKLVGTAAVLWEFHYPHLFTPRFWHCAELGEEREASGILILCRAGG